MINLALATQIPPESWAALGERGVITAFSILEEQEEAAKREEKGPREPNGIQYGG